MVEILAWEDIEKIQDPQVKKYLEYTKQKVSRHLKPWNFKDWGYWVVIEQKEELEKPFISTKYTLPPLKESLIDNLELYEKKDGVCELLLMLDNDFGISLVMKEEFLKKIDIGKSSQIESSTV